MVKQELTPCRISATSFNQFLVRFQTLSMAVAQNTWDLQNGDSGRSLLPARRPFPLPPAKVSQRPFRRELLFYSVQCLVNTLWRAAALGWSSRLTPDVPRAQRLLSSLLRPPARAGSLQELHPSVLPDSDGPQAPQRKPAAWRSAWSFHGVPNGEPLRLVLRGPQDVARGLPFLQLRRQVTVEHLETIQTGHCTATQPGSVRSPGDKDERAWPYLCFCRICHQEADSPVTTGQVM